MHEGSLVYNEKEGRGRIVSCSLCTLSKQKGFKAKVRFKNGKVISFGKYNKYITDFLFHITR